VASLILWLTVVLQVSNKLIHDLLTRVPTRSGAREFVRTVTQRLLPSPLHPEHFRAMLQTDMEATADVQVSLLHPVMDLVTVASSVSGRIYSGGHFIYLFLL
jgi:hypothetical protein